MPARALALSLLVAALASTALAGQDTIVVRADNPPVWGDHPRLVEELRIGALEGDSTYTFGQITGVAVTDDAVWIADAQSGSVVRRYGRDGRFLGVVARRGEGPGELQGPVALQRLPDGRVVAFETAGPDLTLYETDGTFVAGRRAPIRCMGGTGLTIPSSRYLVVDSAGSVLLRSCMMMGAFVPGQGAPPPMSTLWVRMDLGGTVSDTLVIPDPDNTEPSVRTYPFGGMAPYTAKTLAAVSPLGYLVTARTDRYALHRPLRDGRVVRIERSWTPVRARAEERAQYEAAMEASRRRFVALGSKPSAEIAVPDTKPPFWALQVDQDGRIWVARHQEGFFKEETPQEMAARMKLVRVPGAKMEWWEPLVTDVIEPSGRYLGTVAFPNGRATIAWASGDELWALELGEFDEPYVVRYRVEHP